MGIETIITGLSGGGVKSIQRGVETAAGIKTINSVNVDKSFIYSVSKGSAGTVAATGTVSAASISIPGVTGSLKIASASSGSSLHQALSSGGTLTSGYMSLPAYTATHPAASISGGTTNLTVKLYSAVLTNSTTITVDGPCEWQVIEFN